jgi:hypothetical protein
MELPNNNRTATDELPSCARVTATRIAGVVALFLTVALMPRLASAQMSTWNVSIYNQLTESADDNSMYGTTQVYDNSSGCTHSGYITTSTLYNASNVLAGTWAASGLYSSVSAPVNGSGGTWTLVGTVQFHCSCAGPIGVGSDKQSEACLAHLKQPRNLPRSPAVAGDPRPRPAEASLVGQAKAVTLTATVQKVSVPATPSPVSPPAAVQRPDGSHAITN